MTFSIRRAEPFEKDLVIELSHHFDADYLEYVVDFWIDRQPGGIYLAREGSTVVGCCALYFPSPRQGWLQGMRVHPSFRRRGIGFKLTQYLAAEAESLGAERVALVTAPTNLSARQLALKLGFKPLRKDRKVLFYGQPKNCGGLTTLPQLWLPAKPEDLADAWDYLIKSSVLAKSDMYIFHPAYAFVPLDHHHFAEILRREEVWLLPGPAGLWGCLIVGRGTEAGHLCLRHLDLPQSQLEMAMPLLALLMHREDTAFFSAGVLDDQYNLLADFFNGHLDMDELEHWTIMERKK